MDNLKENSGSGEIISTFNLDGKTAEVVRFTESDVSLIEEDLKSLAAGLTETDLKDSVFVAKDPRPDLANAVRDKKVLQIKNLIASGKALCVRIDGKVVAVLGVEQKAVLKDGRALLEATKAATLPEFRKKGIAKKLAIQLYTDQMQKNPDAVFVAFSRNPAVIGGLGKAGFKNVPADSDNMVAKAYTEKFDKQTMKDLLADNYRVIYFDPKEATTVDKLKMRVCLFVAKVLGS